MHSLRMVVIGGAVLIAVVSGAVAAPAGLQRGDLNGDGILSPLDVVMMFQYLYKGGAAPDPLWVGDANCDSRHNLADLTALVNHVFRGGDAPCDGGFALKFDGTNDLAEIPFNPAFNADEYTIEAWINIADPQVDYISSIVDRWTFDPVGQVWAMWLIRGEPYTLGGGSGGANNQGALTAGSLAVGQWIHVAYTRDGSGMERLFVDGSEVGHMQFPATVNTAETPIRIGHSNGGTLRAFYGMIDEVRLWNVARTGAEIAATRNTLLTGAEPGLIGYWNFDEGWGDTFDDLSSTGAFGRLGKLAGPDYNDPKWVISTAPVN